MTDRAPLRVLALLRKYGWNATSFQILDTGFEYWFDGDDACVAYVDTGGAWVVAGAPITELSRLEAVAANFAAAARRHQRRCLFFAVEPRLASATTLSLLHIGEQPLWDASKWSATIQRTASVRQQLARARHKKVTHRAISSEEVAGGPARDAIDALIRRWLDERRLAPMSFLVGRQPFRFVNEHRYWIAEREGAVVGFLDAVPVFARRGWLFQSFIRDPLAPNGTVELLIDTAMRTVAAEGCRHVTLGLAPLAAAQGWLRLTRDLSKALYDFGGLHSFKAKLRPTAWDPIYLAYPRGTSRTLALYDALVAFAGGSLIRFGGATVLRGLVGSLSV